MRFKSAGYTAGMSDEITVSGKTFISSKRASELSAYTQDYIGQLARGGHIEAQRVGGLWYISMDSLQTYKEKSETEKEKPESPRYAKQVQDPETLVFFDGKQFISAARAAEMTRYNQDYVGQLARSGQILSRQIGNRWYIEQEGILKHKKEKDALLAAVQSEAVGLYRGKNLAEESRITINLDTKKESYFTYVSESADLMPVFPRKKDVQEIDEDGEESQVARSIPIHVLGSKDIKSGNALEEGDANMYAENNRIPRTRNASRALTVVALTFSVVLVLSTGLIFFQSGSFSGNRSLSTDESFVATMGVVSDRLVSVIENWLVPELVYSRLQN